MNAPNFTWLQRRNKRNNFSYLNLFELPGGDHNVDLRTKFREIGVFYWACLIFAPYFIAEQSFAYQTQRYWPILIPLHALIILSPLVYRLTKSFHWYAGYAVTLCMTEIILLIAYEGGNLSPGAFWLAGQPMAFGLFYGRRGVMIGSALMTATFIGFIVLNHWTILPNLVAEHGDYEQEKIINLIGFGIYNVIISYYFINIEEKAKQELHLQRQETDNLLRMMVHNVVTPINAFQLMSFAVKNGRKEPGDILTLADNALAELSAIVQQVSKLRALKDGKLKLVLSEVLLQTALAEAISLQQEQAKQKQLLLDLQLHPEPVYVMVDEALLKSAVLANLISNAIKFSHVGQTITILLVATTSQVTLMVIDNGIGMSADLLHKIFDPTEPTTRPGTIGESGTGYGMPLVKMVLTKLNGDITVESNEAEQGAGTKVAISLPRYMPL
jgi:signal transduction histidine kinase